ncbi:BAG1 BAG family molecular chaperone regulator 1 [Arabiibacter massiliensis]|uniref:BAG1 BAG family molecular chaperone regulator 1 n=1 Tax=Arabiibacter massiliensis TaxID=1870985 RepID=UPI000B4249FD|nr:BAG1 BAG family molecular chaperone regulator 1 [Arabiibacter massiliensis]
MAEIEILEQETVLDDPQAETDEARMAADDLRRIEEEVKQEAEASVEDFDEEGDERRSVEAASAAFDFDQAEVQTEAIEEDVEDRMQP